MFTSSGLNQDDPINPTPSPGQKIKDDTREGLERVKKHVEQAGHEARQSTRMVGEDLNEWAHDAGQKARGMIDDAGERISSLTQTTEDYIRDKPVQSALMALGVGFIAGLLSRR